MIRHVVLPQLLHSAHPIISPTVHRARRTPAPARSKRGVRESVVAGTESGGGGVGRAGLAPLLVALSDGEEDLQEVGGRDKYVRGEGVEKV
jgi:hypothetical protein